MNENKVMQIIVNLKKFNSDLTVLKRETKKVKIFNKYIYFNKVYGGK